MHRWYFFVFLYVNITRSYVHNRTEWQIYSGIHSDGSQTDCLSQLTLFSAVREDTNFNKNSDCFVLAISTHGFEVEGHQYLQGSDGKHIELCEVLSIISNEESLEGKPKLVFVQVRYESHPFNVLLGLRHSLHWL